jgi:hypothetical protein
MKRQDNVDISSLNIPEPPYRSEVFYGKGGNIVDESSAFAKQMTVGKWDVHFIWFWRGHLFNPYGSDILRRSQEELAKLKKVSKDTFDLYMKYLKTKNTLYLTRAARKAIEQPK